MIKKQILIIFMVVPFILGYFTAEHRSKKAVDSTNQTVFFTPHVLQNDKITMTSQGNIFVIANNGVKQITQNEQVIESAPVEDKFVAITKKTNYSSLKEYDKSGQVVKTLFNGNTGKFDTMSWITDPAVNPEQTKIAYVSDKDRIQTQAPDNALYTLDLSTGKSTNIVKPNPYSGGLAHPVWDPVNSNILLYDYYQYDPKTLTPYSTIMEYDKRIGIVLPLTTDKQNAYQSSFSPDGMKLLFLIRNDDTLNVSLYMADVTEKGLSNEHKLETGDFAYPQFSNSTGYIYYLGANGNSGYNLFAAKVVNYKLVNILPITGGSKLLGNSSFAVSQAN